MKLYEFIYTDKQNLPENALLGRVQEFLSKESELQGWASDYKFHQCKEVEPTSQGEKNYSFEVIGRYLDSEGVEEDADLPLSSSTGRESIAAKDADA